MKLSLGAYAPAVEQRLAVLTSARAAERIWRRDATFWGGGEGRHASVASRLGWLDIAIAMRKQTPEIESFADDVRAAGFRDAVLLGMGGSSLAPEVMRLVLPRDASFPALHVLDTTDPGTIRDLTDRIDPTRTLFYLSSKSGGTIEVSTLFAYFHALVVERKRESAGENFVAITDPGTALRDIAAKRGFRRIFTNSADIGGRYSALSYFGLVPAAVSGIDIATLLDHALEAANAAREPSSDAIRLGATLGALALTGRDKVTFIISDALAPFGVWIEQLLAESTGKQRMGILPVAGEPRLDARRYGDDRVFVFLRLAGEPEHELLAAAVSAHHPAITIEFGDVMDLGREFFRWEFATSVAGQVLDIDPFDQPNVQGAKDNTARVLAGFESSGRLDPDGVDQETGSVCVTADGGIDTDIERAIAALLAQLRTGDYFAITAYMGQSAVADEAFSEIRADVVAANGNATTLGYGPRFLHSTGQFHKGGPPRGVFLQLTQDDAHDVAIPGRPYTFGELKRAQAIGDFESLVATGRPVLRVHLRGAVEDGLRRVRDAVRSAVRQQQAAGR